MAHVPEFVKLAGHNGRCDIPQGVRNGEALLWVSSEPELDGNLESVMSQLEGAQGSEVTLEVWGYAVSDAGSELVKRSEHRARISEVGINPENNGLVVNIVWLG